MIVSFAVQFCLMVSHLIFAFASELNYHIINFLWLYNIVVYKIKYCLRYCHQNSIKYTMYCQCTVKIFIKNVTNCFKLTSLNLIKKIIFLIVFLSQHILAFSFAFLFILLFSFPLFLSPFCASFFSYLVFWSTKLLFAT